MSLSLIEQTKAGVILSVWLFHYLSICLWDLSPSFKLHFVGVPYTLHSKSQSSQIKLEYCNLVRRSYILLLWLNKRKKLQTALSCILHTCIYIREMNPAPQISPHRLNMNFFPRGLGIASVRRCCCD